MKRGMGFFHVEHAGNTLIVLPQGDTLGILEAHLKDEIAALYRLLDDPAVVNLVVDFGTAPYFGSIVIGAILGLCKRASDAGGRAVLCNASEAMYEAIKTMKLEMVYPYFPTRPQALEAVNK